MDNEFNLDSIRRNFKGKSIKYTELDSLNWKWEQWIELKTIPTVLKIKLYLN